MIRIFSITIILTTSVELDAITTTVVTIMIIIMNTPRIFTTLPSNRSRFAQGRLIRKRFFPWIQKITQLDGPGILRLKGIIAFENDDDRYVVQGIHMIVEGDHQRAWKDGEKRESRIVFIGRDLDEEKLKRTFEACQT